MRESGRAPKSLIALALVAVYVIWGSTYLLILFAIDTIPPFTMAGIRFSVAGWLLYIFLRIRGAPAPRWGEWRAAALIGALLLAAGNGGITWAEQRVPSGVAALIVAGVPAWMVLMDWAAPDGVRPRGRVIGGVVLGLAGIALLMFAGESLQLDRVDTLGALVVVLASLAWALGSILSRYVQAPASIMLATAMQMMVAGGLLLAAGVATGEWRNVDLEGITGSSLLALGYLIVFGSWIGFSAYLWLLRVTTPAIVSTYAYVNPAVAVLLGWAFAGESIGQGTIVAMAIIISGVILITLPSRKSGPTGEIDGQLIEGGATVRTQ